MNTDGVSTSSTGSAWNRVRLGDLVTIRHGWPFKTEFISEDLKGGPIVVNIGNFRYSGGFRFGETRIREYKGEYPSGYELLPGDILIVMTCQTSGGEILGIPARVPDDGRTYLHNQRLGKVVVKRPDLVTTEFLYWLFLWKEFNRWLFTSASGSKILHTAPERIENFEFDLPPLDAQRAIARVLGSIEEKIELNHQMNKTLESIASAIFKHWFVDFEFPNEEGKPYKSSGGEMVRDEKMGCEIPKGWRMGALGSFVEFVKGRKPIRVSQTPAEGYRPQILIDVLNDGNPVYASPEGMVNVSKPDPIMVMDGASSGRVEIGHEGVLGSTLAKVVCTKDTVSSFYVYHFLKINQHDINENTTGTSIPHADKGRIQNYPIVLPDKRTLERFDLLVGNLIYGTIANKNQTTVLSKVRDALLPKLMSGKIRVPVEVG
jgi:type I restriction enzyme, S subunit